MHIKILFLIFALVSKTTLGFEKIKALRPNAPFDAAAPVVGPAPQTSASTSSILQLLAAIKKKLDCLNNEVAACCACDFFITQDTPGPKNHLVSDPITEPGVYCLAEDVTGTITIETSNVTIHFNGYTLTAGSPGVISVGNDHIHIDGGTITEADAAIQIESGFDVTINNMTLLNNDVGIGFDSINNFTIQHCQCIGSTDQGIILINSNEGTVSYCDIRDSENDSLIALSLTNCNRIQHDTIAISNHRAGILNCVDIIGTHECSLNNITIMNNSATTFKGFILHNSNENILNNCSVNNNTSINENDNTALFGFSITTEEENGGSHNQLLNCTVNNNTSSSDNGLAYLVGASVASDPSVAPANGKCANTIIKNLAVQNNSALNNAMGSFLSGISLATAFGTVGTFPLRDNLAPNCVIDGCAITGNICRNTGGFQGSGISFIGITAGGTVGLSRELGNDAAANLVISNCTVSNNIGFKSGSENSGAIWVGINLGGNIGGLSTIGNDTCVNALVHNCAINNNDCTFADGQNGAAFMYCINLGGGLGGPSTSGSNTCDNCVIQQASMSHNICTGSAGFFVGLNIVGNLNGGGTVGTNSCSNTVIANCAINNNVCDAPGSALLAAIDMGTNAGGSCNNSRIDNVRICKNRTITTSSSTLGGILFNGAAGTSVGGCNDITCSNCLIELNSTATTAGRFFGFYLDGTGNELDGGCNNIILRTCEVHKNTGIEESQAYHVFTNPGQTAGARNLQIDNCSAKNNTSESQDLNGFNFELIRNAVLQQCVSAENTTNGFRLLGVADSVVRECKALENGDSGFLLMGNPEADPDIITNNVTLTDCQALGNGTDGFTFTETTTACFIRENIAQNNSEIGFNNIEADEWKHQFLSNFAQANGATPDDNYENVPLVVNPIVDPELVTVISNIST